MIYMNQLLKKFLFCSFFLINSLQANWTSSPTTLDKLPSPNASSTASIVTDKHGNVTAAWLENTISGTTVQAAYYSISSNSWTNPTILDQYNGGAASPVLVVDQSGVVTAVWVEYLGGNYLVQSARLEDNDWSSPVTLNNGNANLAQPLLMVDSFGNVTVVWFENEGSNFSLQAARYADGSWTNSPTTLDGENPNANANIIPLIVVDNFGNVTVAWVENRDSSLFIEAARFSEGAWSEAVVLNNGIQTPNAFPSMSLLLGMIVDEAGNVTVSWLENSTFPIAVQVARFYAPPILIDSPRHLQGIQRITVFGDYENILEWEAPRHGNSQVVSYQIYRGKHHKKLIAEISSSEQLKFIDNVHEKINYTYWVVSVDQYGNTSTPARVTIDYLK